MPALPLEVLAVALEPMQGGAEHLSEEDTNDCCTKDEYDHELDGTPLVRESMALRTLTELMEETGIDRASMLVKKSNDIKRMVLKKEEGGVYLSVSAENYVISTSGTFIGKPIFVPHIRSSICHLKVFNEDGVPKLNFVVKDKSSGDTISSNTMHVPHSLTNFLYIFSSSVFPGSSSPIMDWSSLVEDDTGYSVQPAQYARKISILGIECFCKAWNITKEEQSLCKKVVDKASDMGLYISGRIEESCVSNPSTISAYYKGQSILSRVGKELGHFLSSPFYVLSYFSGKERHLFLNDLLKMPAKVLDHVLARLMSVYKDYEDRATVDNPSIAPFTFESYLYILRNLPKIYLSDIASGMFNNPKNPVTLDGRTTRGLTVTISSKVEANGWINLSPFCYFPIPRLSSYPTQEFNKKALCILINTPWRGELLYRISESPSAIRENDTLLSFLRDPTLEEAYKNFVEMHRQGLDDPLVLDDVNEQAEGEPARIYFDVSLINFINYIKDGGALYEKYGRKHFMVPVTGTMKNKVKKAVHNHKIEAAISLDTKLLLAGESGVGNPMPCEKELHPKVEKYRVKWTNEIITLGSVLGHCIGKYATITDGNYFLIFRYKTVCARVTKDFTSVLECYDANNKVTLLSRSFEKFITKCIYICNGKAPFPKKGNNHVEEEEALPFRIGQGPVEFVNNLGDGIMYNKTLKKVCIDNTMESLASKLYFPETIIFEE